MENDIAFCTYCFGDKYVEQQHRLKHSIATVYSQPKIFVFDHLPQGARSMDESLYGFKPHAIQAAYDQGFRKIVWFDTAIVLFERLDRYDEIAKEYGVVAVQDDNKLTGVTADKAIHHFKISREWLIDKHLVGGSFYYFDFGLPLCNEIFRKWMRAERKDIFGSASEEASEQLQGHRADETCMAISLYMSGSKPFQDDRYNSENSPIMVKKHFK